MLKYNFKSCSNQIKNARKGVFLIQKIIKGGFLNATGKVKV